VARYSSNIYDLGVCGQDIFYFSEIVAAAGSMGLRDGRGRSVSEGTCPAKGKVIGADGKVEAVAVVVGVR